MKNIAKRFLSAAIAIIILIGFSPVNSFKIKSSAAEETTLSGTCGENVTYSLNENTGVLTISGMGDMADYLSNSPSPFYENEKIKEVIIEDGVTRIGSHAFEDCNKLSSVAIAKSIDYIGGSAFSGCSSLEDVEIPNGVQSIYSAAFKSCSSLKNIIVPRSVKYIGNSAFLDCSGLTTVSLLCKSSAFKKVKTIYPETFSGCSSLINITLPEDIETIDVKAFQGCTSLTSIILPDNVKYLESYAFSNCSSLINITFSNKIRSIGSYTFDGCKSLINITIPESVTSIGNFAFNNCSSLTSITTPERVTSIGNAVFYGCSSLTSITIPEGVTSIDSSTFYGCSSLTSVTIPEGLTSIGGSAFNGCSSLTSITIPESVTSIGSDTFSGCSSLTSITIPEGVKSIGAGAFSGCSSLTSITIPESVTSIGSYTFFGCNSLASIAIPESVTSIGKYAFYNCSSLTRIAFPEGVTSIGSYAFSGCSSLTSITIPESVTSIDDSAFLYVNNIIYNGSLLGSPWGAKCINGYIEYGLVYRDSSKKELLGCSSSRTGSVSIPNSVEKIGGLAFYNCSSLTSITLPTPVKSYTLSYNANGGSNAPVQRDVNIICKGWSEIPNAFDVKFYCGEKYNYSPNANITLYAIWNDSANGAVSSAVPVRTGYTFKGWSTNENAASASITAGSNISISKDTTLYAVWEKIPCTVTLNANGGTCDTNTISLKYGDEITLPIPIKEDCEFLGWYTELEGGERINDSTVITSDMTLYAHWYSVCKFKISSVEATAGDVIEVPVKIVNNKGIMGFSAQILYDNSVLTPIEVKKGAAFSGGNIVSNLEKLTPGELKIVGYSAKESRVDDVIYTVAFRVSDSAEGIYKLRLSYDPDNTFDGDLNEVSLQCEDGSVDVKKNTADRTLIYMEDQNTICGNEISIPIKIKNQKELQAVSFNFEYDSAVLDFVSVTSDFDNISYAQNGKFIAISLSSLDKCKDETPIAYVNLVAKSVAETVVKLSSDNDIDVNNGIVSVKENYSTKPTLYADNVVGKVDSTVKVPICIKNNPGISGFKIKISYDPTALQPESLIAGASFPAIYDNLGRKNGEISAIWIESSGKNVVDNGEIFNINFKILKKGTHKISVTYSKADTFNEKSEELNLICRSGNVFAGNLLMPKEGTSIVIDYSNKYIYGIDAGIQSIKPYVYTDEGYTISEITAKQGFGTSAKVNLMLENDMVETYTVVLFGDVNGDGWYDGQDAVLVNMIANGMLTREQVGEAVWMAADCNHDGVIDQGDVDLLNRAGLLLSKVDQTKPT